MVFILFIAIASLLVFYSSFTRFKNETIEKIKNLELDYERKYQYFNDKLNETNVKTINIYNSFHFPNKKLKNNSVFNLEIEEWYDVKEIIDSSNYIMGINKKITILTNEKNKILKDVVIYDKN